MTTDQMGADSEEPRIRPVQISHKFHLSTLRKTSPPAATLSQFCSIKEFQSVGSYVREQLLDSISIL